MNRGDSPSIWRSLNERHAQPSTKLVPEITAPKIDRWLTAKPGEKQAVEVANKQLAELIEQVIKEVY